MTVDSAAWDAAAAKVEYGHCSRCGADLIGSLPPEEEDTDGR